MAKPYKHILVTTDLSPFSINAFESARQQVLQAGQDKVKLTLLYVLEDVTNTSLPYLLGGSSVIKASGVMEVAESESRQKLQELVKEHFSDFQVEIRLLVSTIPSSLAIVQFAKEEGVDLIVLATHGRSGISGVLLGSTALKILHEAPCPVLAVPITKESNAV